MKTKFQWMFAVILICGLTVSVSSCKKEPAPKKTVLTGMVATGVIMYDSITYSYDYDAQCRLVRSLSRQTNDNYVLLDLRFTYADNSIRVEGTENGKVVTYNCTLDSEGRITRMDRTSVGDDTPTNTSRYDYTYNADGYLASVHKASQPDSEGINSVYVWEGGELKAVNTEDGVLSVEYETSDAPAQALFINMGYDELAQLCAQGCFGKLPAHMPSKRTVITTFPSPMPSLSVPFDYVYTTNADGRLATCTETRSSDGGVAHYTFNWEER